MPRTHAPRRGSLGFRPRGRARDESVRFKSWPESEKPQPLGFAAYKVGMTHLIASQTRKGASSQGMDVTIPVTVLAVPPLKVFGVRAYQKSYQGSVVLTDVLAEKTDSLLRRRLNSLKKSKPADFALIEKNAQRVTDVRILAHTNRNDATGVKKPHVFEIGIGGKSTEEKLSYAKNALGKDISFSDVFAEKEFIDVKAVTTGKGWQGPVKRWGVKIQPHKSQKQRVVGSIGPWHPNATQWTVPMPGNMGYWTRTELTKKIIKIGANGKKVTPNGGFLHFGDLDCAYALIEGSLQGPAKRVLGLRKAARPPAREKIKIGEVNHVSVSPKQGN